MRKAMLVISLSLVALPLLGQGAPPQGAANQPYTMEYYYKVQWGHQQEFLQLFLKNHYPLLQKNAGSGRILSPGSGSYGRMSKPSRTRSNDGLKSCWRIGIFR